MMCSKRKYQQVKTNQTNRDQNQPTVKPLPCIEDYIWNAMQRHAAEMQQLRRTRQRFA